MSKKGYLVESGKATAANPNRCWMNIACEKLNLAVQENACFYFCIRLENSYYNFKCRAQDLKDAFDKNCKIKQNRNSSCWDFYIDYKTGNIYSTCSASNSRVIIVAEAVRLMGEVIAADKLLKKFVKVEKELHSTGVFHTYNNPASEYAELLLMQKFGFIRTPNGLLSQKGNIYEVKCRRKHAGNMSNFGIIRKIDFTHVALFVFEENFDISDAYLLNKKFIEDHEIWKFVEHENGYKIMYDKLKETLNSLTTKEREEIVITNKFQ